MGFAGMTFVVDCECFEGIVFAEDVVWAGLRGVKFAVGTCLGIGLLVGGFARPERECWLVAWATCWFALLLEEGVECAGDP